MLNYQHPEEQMIIRAIEKCLETASLKGWSKTFWAFDIHGTILKPTFQHGANSTEFYPFAKETMQLLTKQKDITLIMFTCSYPKQIAAYIQFFIGHDIVFDYVNENPETLSGPYGHYEEKFYFNILFEDKAGFDPCTEWEPVYNFLLKKRFR
jgi:hypothetical protein